MKKIAIWGAGIYGSRWLIWLGDDKVYCFIDSNPEKSNTIFYNKPVFSPENIVDWKELFVYVPYNYYDEIKKILVSKGLEEDKDFSKYSKNIIFDYTRLVRDYNECLVNVNNIPRSFQGAYAFIGDAWTSNTNNLRLMQKIISTVNNGKFVIFTVADEIIRARDNLLLLRTPLLCGERVAYENRDSIGFNISTEYDTEDGLVIDACAKQLGKSSQNAQYKENEDTVKNILHFYNTALDFLRPSAVFFDTGVSVNNIVCNHLCKKRNISVLFCHQGILPGTIHCEPYGELGKSIPAVNSSSFKRLPILGEEKEKAKKVWEFLYETRINRKVQPTNDRVQKVKRRLDINKKTVVFLGQNDPLSHMVPYDEESRKFYSPIFSSSVDAASYIGQLCEKNNLNFIYKPHPNYVVEDVESKLTKSTLFIDYCDINELIDCADVVVTILSTANYNALTRYKPVVMLGYTQTKGQGCTYEAFTKEEIEGKIVEAIEYGFTDDMKEKFVEHIARLNRYYLYDDMSERAVRYGQKIPDSINGFYELQNMLKIYRS